jgi:hypothetical protein
MPLRVFISSTMKDLENERDAVCRKLREFSMEPVNAEGWLPDGAGSWDRIAGELAASHIFVLLLGESYGWIPTAGPRSETGASVTEIEYLEARQQKLPIFPFVKNLSYNSDRTSDDAQKRDAFRERVMDWEAGRFVAKFDRAFDLAEKVSKALMGVITDAYVKSVVQARVAVTKAQALPQKPLPAYVRPPWMPEALLRSILQDDAILFVGAGMSAAAGLPTATALADYLRESLREISPDYAGTARSFLAAASDFVALTSREQLGRQIQKFMDPPALEESDAHRVAVGVFDRIFTTNFDNLLERAMQAVGDDRVVFGYDVPAPLPERVLVKLHGSVDDDSLLITESGMSPIAGASTSFWAELRRLLQTKVLVVVGMTLYDGSLVKLLEDSMPLRGGFFIAPRIDVATQARISRWQLVGVEASIDDVFAVIAANTKPSSPAG